VSAASDLQLEALLEYLKQTRGFDFGAYKPSTLQRRIEKRLQALNLKTFGEYRGYLEAHPDEFTPLFNAILINVTEFFRDPPAWEYVAAEIVPELIRGKGPDEAIRVWSAGCATGEEAYSLTMLFAEALGPERLHQRLKVYATDIDEDAIAVARHATYPARAMENVPRHLVEKYFNPEGERYSFRRDARSVVIFARHNLLQDPPISRVDLLVCRNTLMYFTNEAQSRVLARLHFALNDAGYLFAGRAEMLLTHTRYFAPVSLKRRVFRRVAREPWLGHLMAGGQGAEASSAQSHGSAAVRYSLAFEVKPLAQVLLDARGNLVAANEAARRVLGLSVKDEGRPLRDLNFAAWPQEVLRAIGQPYAGAAPLTLNDIRLPSPSGEPRYYEVGLHPLRDNSGALIGMSITFDDVTRYRVLQEEFQRSREELQTVSEELQSSNEELETTNEELQSTVEELETTNEELQSTNEELETMNEELQSTNEELHTSNDELQARSEELSRTNTLLHSILSSLRSGVAVVDAGSHVIMWNRASEDLWGLRAEEVLGKAFFGLDIGLPVDQLGPAIRACLAGEHQETTLQAINRRGKPIVCKIFCAPLGEPQQDLHGGAVIVMEERAQPEA
jgi:two-component system CheB/CheR fusion protein